MPLSEKCKFHFGRSTTMTNEVARMMRGAIGGAALGGGIGGMLFGLAGSIMVGLEPIVFMVCGIYAGAVYGGIVGALRGARAELAPAMVRSRAA
jgi:hypothetical protein